MNEQHDPHAIPGGEQPQQPQPQPQAPQPAPSPWEPTPTASIPPAPSAPESQPTVVQDPAPWIPQAQPTDFVAPLRPEDEQDPNSRDRRRGPGWFGVIGLVGAGMILSSGLTLGSVIAYDQLRPEPVASTAEHGPAQPNANPAALTTPSSWNAVAQSVSAGTVAIRVETAKGGSQGTGVVIDKDGTIVTNNHVIEGAQEAEVTFSNGLSYAAKIIGTDPSTDIAVVRLTDPPKDLATVPFADSEAVQVGQPVMAVGAPLGLKNTVTTGIISAVDRPVTAGDGESEPSYTSALQTDAAINPGNSGGPLVDNTGKVIGINSSIAGLPSGEEKAAGSIGLGFAIPSNTVQMIADQLIAKGSARHAYLGVTSQDSQATVGQVTHSGAEVMKVDAGSPAAIAGLRPGDLITTVDDVAVPTAAALTGVVRGLPVGSEHQLTVLRDGKEITLTVTFAARA